MPDARTPARPRSRCWPAAIAWRARFFGLPFGRLGPGAPADLVVFDYRPPTPLTSENLAGHLLFGLDRSHVRSVLVAGRWVVRERRLANLDAGEVFAHARLAAEAVWRRMARA